jgi:PD-(D/E)XK nuclease superfamily protein
MNTITKVGGRNFNLDLHKNRIDFLDNRFYITEAGSYVPSVTTVLDCYPKGPAFYEWLKKVGEDADTIRDEAGERGSIVHGLTEKYDEGEEVMLMNDNGYIQYKLLEWAMFERYIDFRKRFPCNMIHTELHLCSEKLGTAGTLDRVITLSGRTIILDIKTSGSLSDHFWLQLSAYKQLLAEVQPDLQIDGYAILWLNAKTRTEGRSGAIQGHGWQLIERDTKEFDRDWKLFLATQQLWQAERGDMKPRQLSYTLSHKL